jgi:hypothetical protein
MPEMVQGVPDMTIGDKCDKINTNSTDDNIARKVNDYSEDDA